MSEKEMTAPNVSVGADTEQSSQNLIDNSLTDFDPNFKGSDEMQREILRMMDPSYLKTVSMSELLDNVYQSKPPLMDGLLYPGYLPFCRCSEAGQELSDDPACVSHQHRHAAVELPCPKRHGVVPCP